MCVRSAKFFCASNETMTSVDSKPDPASFADQRQQAMVRNQPKPPTLRMVPEMSKAGRALIQESAALDEQSEEPESQKDAPSSQPSVAEVTQYLSHIVSRRMIPDVLCTEIDRLSAPPATIVSVAPVGLAFAIGVICAISVGYLSRRRSVSL